MNTKKEITIEKITQDCDKYFFDLTLDQKKNVQQEWTSLQPLLQKVKDFDTFDLKPLFLPTFVRNHTLRNDHFVKNDKLEECFKGSTKFEKRFVLINEKTKKPQK